MTKEGIKAVRFCCGYNTDIRHKLDWNRDYQTAYDHKINTFLFENRWSIFGASFIEKSGAKNDYFAPADHNPTPEQLDDNNKILRFIAHETEQVCSGRAEE